MKKRLLTAVLIMAICLLSLPIVSFAADGQTAGSGGEYAQGEAIFCIRKSAVSTQRTDPLIGASESLMVLSDVSPAGEDITTQSDDVITELRFVKSDNQSTDELIAALKAKPGVLFAEPNYIYHGTPLSQDDKQTVSSDNDGITTQAEKAKANYLKPDLTKTQYAYSAENGINVPDWNNKNNRNAEDVIVAVLDSGIDVEHDDLKNVLWNEGLKYPDLVKLGGGAYGINVAGSDTKGETYDTTDVEDDYLHGTHVSGIIGAEWNGIGVSGAANGVKILTVKGLNDANAMSTDSIIKAFNYIVTAKKAGVNIRVVNNSWGGGFESAAMAALLDGVAANNIPMTFSAGNDSTDCDTTAKYGTFLRNNGSVVVVDSSDRNLAVSEFSNFGKVTTDVFAPGSDIMSTYPRFKAEPDIDKSQPVAGTEKDQFDQNKQRLINFTPSAFDLKVSDYDLKFTAENGKAEIGQGKGYEGKNGMVLTSLGEKGSAYACQMDISGDKPLYLTMRAYSPVNKTLLVFATDIGDETTYMGKFLDQGWNTFSVNVENANLEKCWLAVYYPDTVEDSKREVVLSDLFFTNDLLPYKSLDGTSMACPAVSGEAAILAHQYPNATSEELAAMIDGSVRKVETFGPKSQYGGIADTALALGNTHAPVLNNLTANQDGTYTLSGYYFGETQGQITIGGSDATASKWTDKVITFSVPENIPAGKTEITVTTATGSNSQFYELGTSSKCYERLPVPDNDNFIKKSFNTLFGLDHQIYAIRTDFATIKSALWRYSPDTKQWKELGGDLAFQTFSGRCCTWNHQVIFGAIVDEGSAAQEYPNGAVAILDPTEGAMSVTYIPLLQGMDLKTLSFVNSGEHVLMIATKTENNEKKTFVYEIDPRNHSYVKIADYPSVCMNPLITTDASGKIFVIGGNTIDHKGSTVPYKNIDEIVYQEPGKAAIKRVKSDFFPADWYANQDFDIYGGAIKDRILITGPVVNDEKGVVKQDTYLMTITPKAENAEAQTAAVNDAYDVSIEPTDKVFSQSKVFYENAIPYDNQLYAIGSTDNESRNVIFAHGAVETIPSPGDSSIPIVKMRVHGRNYGWSQGWMEDTQTLGTTGQALRLEAVEAMIQTDGEQTPGLYLDYRVHMKNFGWGCYVHDGATAGTTGQSRRIEAIQMKLFGEKAANYDIYYRVHMKDIGWGKWAKNDEIAGTTGQSRRFEAIEVQLVPKGCAAPDND